MTAIGVSTAVDQLVLTRGRDFRWTFQNLDTHNEPTNFPAGDLYFELNTGGETNALQEVNVTSASGGTYTLTLDGQTTDDIDYYDVTVNPHGIDGDITDALEALSNVGLGNVVCHPAKLVPVWELQLELNAGVNEIQKVLLTNADGGTFTLRFAGETTSAIAYNASAATVDSALEALGTIPAGGVSTTAVTDGWSIEFTGGLASTNVQKLIVNDDALTADSGSASAAVSVTRPGDGPLTEPIVNLLNKYVNEFFNTFDSLLGVDIDFVVHDNLNATLKVTSLKSFDEVSLITFAVDVTSSAIENFLTTVLELVGLIDTVTVDFYWDHTFQVEFVNDLGNKLMPAMTSDVTDLTGVNDEQAVTVTVLEPGKPQMTVWEFEIVGTTATIKIDSEEADLISARTHWQLVFLPDGEAAGGDPVARGRVTVQD